MLCVCALMLYWAVPVIATEGNVIYSADAGKFIFAPCSDHSPTDLFVDFKDVMPGDSLTQTVMVRNDAANGVKVKLYMRALGAHEDSRAFLSKLRLRVEGEGVLFDAAASETAQLTQWVCLGTLYSGGQADLKVTLDIPVALDNGFQQSVGYLDWEFMAEEYPIEATDPVNPETGDAFPLWVWFALMGLSLCVIILMLMAWREK